MPRNNRRPYPWPASRLKEKDVMHSLHLESKRTGQPITVIIEQAVCAHLERGLDQAVQPIGFVQVNQQPRPAA